MEESRKAERGAGVLVRVVDGPIDEAAAKAAVSSPENGAVLLFHGVVRDHHEGRRVSRIEYHCYRAMAERELERVAAEVAARYEIRGLAVIHRVGELLVGETSLVVAVGAHHRRPAFEAGLEVIDALKRRIPIWKKEHGPDGAAWVEGVTPPMPGAGAAS